MGRHWLVLGAVAAFLFIGTTIKAFTGAKLPPRTVFDAGFIRQANDTCRADIQRLKAERPKPGSREGKEPGDKGAVAAKVDGVADRLQAVGSRLHSLEVADDDEADVGRWLRDWDRYTDLGRQYADAVREESPRQAKLAEEGAKTERRLTLFAQANKLGDCAFS